MLQGKTPFVVLNVLLLAMLACAGPGAAAPDATATFGAALTQAFATAQANLPPPGDSTQIATASNTPLPQPASATPGVDPQATVIKPSDTPAPSNTPGVQGCIDGAEYVADVTIPDNTVIQPGQAFTKTWRLRNSGTCTWVGSYQFAFVGGDHMGGPASVFISGNVAPGSQYDVSVNLVAPASPNTYKGSWRMKNASGQFFGSTPFVQIVVPAPTATSTPITPSATASATPTSTPTATATGVLAPPVGSVTINATNGGQVDSGGGVNPGVNNAGDTSDNKSLQGFVTFNLTSIPSSATLLGARLDLSSHDYLPLGGAVTPFDALGCLRGYKQDYGTVDAGDFFSGTALGALWRFCSIADLSDASDQALDSQGLAVLQAALPTGQIQIRLQFNEMATNNDGVANVLRTTPKLIVNFTVP